MVTLHQRAYKPLPTGEYQAIVGAVSSTTGQFGPELQFDFLLEDANQTQLRAWAGAVFSAKSKLGRWVRALLGELPLTLDTDKLVGKSCTLVVLAKTRVSDETVYNRVEDVHPPRSAVRDLGGGRIVGAQR